MKTAQEYIEREIAEQREDQYSRSSFSCKPAFLEKVDDFINIHKIKSRSQFFRAASKKFMEEFET